MLAKKDSRTKKSLAEHLGKNRQIFTDWGSGKSTPSLTDLFKISKWFGVPLEYIISGEDSPIDDATAVFLLKAQGLTQEQKESVFASLSAQIEYWKKANDNKKKKH